MLRFILVLIALLGTASAALAQHSGTPQEQQACTRDASRFCRPMLGNDMAVQQCLEQHRSALSRSCSRVFASHGM